MIRWSTIALILGVLVAGVAYDRVDTAPIPETLEPAGRQLTPEMVSPAHLTSNWYCPVGSTAADGYATHRVMVSNVGDEAALVTVDALTSNGAGPGLRFDLDPLETEVVDLTTLVDDVAVGAVVEIIGGEGVVGHQVTTVAGVAEGPCSSTAASQWYLGSGATTRDAREYIALLNPSLDDVVFEAEFRIDGRTRIPGELERGVVPARSVRVIDLGEFVAREEEIAATITVVQGQLVVERLQTFDGTLGPRGAAVQLAVTDPAISWAFPAGRLAVGSDNTVVVTNPTDEVAELDVFLDPIVPDDRQFYGLVAVPLTVNPGRSAQIDLIELAEQIDIPLPYELGVRVESANGVPVVAERWQLSPGIDRSLIGAGGGNAKKIPLQDGDETEIPEEELEPEPEPPTFDQPTATVGAATSRGVDQSSTRWVVPWVTMAPDDGTVIVVTGAGGDGDARVEAQVMVGGALQPPVRAIVGPDGRAVLTVTAPVEGAPVVITSDQPIFVEAHVVVPGSRLDVVPAVPTRIIE